MGTNLFVEGRPEPVIIHVTLPRDVEDFSTLASISSALNSIDSFLKRDWSELWKSYQHRRYRDAKLLNFKIESPPEFLLFADPAWIAVILMVIIGYKPIKENIPIIYKDAEKAFKEIQGFSERELQLLWIAIQLTVERVLKSPDEVKGKMVRRITRIYRQLIGEGEIPLKFMITNLNKRRFW